MAWSSKHRILVAGGNSVMHIYKVTAAAAEAAAAAAEAEAEAAAGS
jgi:hypothetical protein